MEIRIPGRAIVDACRQDLGYAFRGLRRSPGLTATIILAFAFGVGVNAAMFTVVDRVFFQAPPGVVEPASVRRLFSFERGYGNLEVASDYFSTTDQTTLTAAGQGAAEIEGYDPETNRAAGERREPHTVAYATTGFFHLAGVHPYRGRFFSADENRYGDPRYVAILNYNYWRQTFGADPSILGQRLRIDATLFTIIGVAQPHFDGMDLDAVDIWAPLAALPPGMEGPWWTGEFQIMRLFARLAKRADARAIQARLNTQYRHDREAMMLRDPYRVKPVQLDSTIRLESAALLQARGALRLGQRNERNVSLMIRLAAVGLLVLVIAMSNVASLLLMRALRRRREIAVRVALGASRQRLMAQMIVESVVLAAVGGAAAVLIAFWTGGALRTMLISDVHWSATVIDSRVVVFTMMVAIVAGAMAGLAPATIALRRDVMAALKAGSSESGRPRSALRITLLVTQTALCMLMLTAAGVFLQSLRHASDTDLGFDPDRLITFNFYQRDTNVVNGALARVRALPGVVAVSKAGVDLRGGSVSPVRFSNGTLLPAMLTPMSGYVDSAYANTVGLRLLRGRFLSRDDVKGSEPVVMIDQAMETEYWRNRDPLVECFQVGAMTDPCRRIVGIVQNVRWDIAGVPPKIFYLPATQSRLPGCCPSITVRTRDRATAATVREIRQVVTGLPGQDPENPPNPRLVTERLEPQFHPWRVAAAMFLLFGILALAAAGAGIYGLVGYDVTQRTHEFGVRITLGATSSNILRLVLGSGVRVVMMGLVAGVASALAAGRVIASLLFETSAYDPIVLAATAVTLSIVALLASLVPAWRATRVDPVVSLRAE